MRRRRLTLHPKRDVLRVPGAPRTRDECLDSERPCPWVGCKHHTYLTVGTGGQVLIDHAHEPHELEISCALDVIDEHPKGATAEVCAEALGVTLERARQIETKALQKLQRNKETPRP